MSEKKKRLLRFNIHSDKMEWWIFPLLNASVTRNLPWRVFFWNILVYDGFTPGPNWTHKPYDLESTETIDGTRSNSSASRCIILIFIQLLVNSNYITESQTHQPPNKRLIIMLQHEKWINLNWYLIILLPFTKPLYVGRRKREKESRRNEFRSRSWSSLEMLENRQ